jgi:hypothetical protein
MYGILLSYPSRKHDPLSDVGDVLPGFPCSYWPQRGQSTLLTGEPNMIEAGESQIGLFWDESAIGLGYSRRP